MPFRHYLEDEDDKPYFTQNSLAFYYEDMERKQKLIETLAKEIAGYDIRLTDNLEAIEKEVDRRLADWDKQLERFPDSVEGLLTKWSTDGTIDTVIQTALIDEKIAPLTVKLADMSYNVKSFGAVGDGVTDDTAAIQNTIDHARDNGGSVFIPDGVYRVAPIKFYTKSHIFGAGMHKSTLKFVDNFTGFGGAFSKNAVLTNDNILPLDFGGTGERNKDFYIHDFCIDGNRQNQTQGNGESECFSLYGAIDGNVENMRLVNSIADGYDIDYCERITAKNLVIDNCAKSGIHISMGAPQGVNKGNNDCTVDGALVTNCLGSGLTDVFVGDMGYRNRFTNIIIKDCGNETNYGCLSIHSHDVICQNIQVINTNGLGLQIKGNNGSFDNINVLNSSGNGVLIQDAFEAKGKNISIKDSGSNGLRFDNTEDCQFVNFIVEDSVNEGVNIGLSKNIILLNLITKRNGKNGVYMFNAEYINISGLISLLNKENGFYTKGGTGKTVRFLSLQGGQVGENDKHGLRLDGLMDSKITDLDVFNNSRLQDDTSTGIFAEWYTENNSIQHNTVRNPTTGNRQAYGIHCRGTNNIGNIVVNNTVKSSGVKANMDLGASTITTTGNRE